VVAAIDVELARRVAIKFVCGCLHDEVDDLDRLVREAKVLAKVSHPNVVAVYDVGRYRADEISGEALPELPDTGVFVVMELVEGETLEQWLLREPATLDILEVFVEAGRGLVAAHAKGVVHRDFKPANVLIGHEVVKVRDFGLACELESDRTGASFELDGTDTAWSVPLLAYMAPEQQRGDPVDARADQYAFCAALVESLGGKMPLARQRLPRRLRRALKRGLDPDPNRRFESMRPLLTALRPPSRRRRFRGALAGLVAGGLVGGAAQLLVSKPDPTAECRATTQAASQSLWNAELRSWVISSLSNDPTAVASLDRYADRWGELHHRACVAQRRAVTECLAARAVEFRTVVEAIVGEEIVDGRAPAVVGALTDIEPCRSASSSTPGEQATIIRRRLARSHGLLLVGNAGAAETEARASLAAAEAFGDPRLLSESRLRLGSVFERQGREQRARELLVAAYEGAVAADLPALAARTAALLVRIEGLYGGDLESAKIWGGRASSHLESVPQEARTRELLEANLGRVRLLSGDAEAAIVHLRRALEIRQDHDDVRWTSAEYLDDIGVALADLGRTEDARENFQRALEIRRTELGTRHPEVADSLDHLATHELASGHAEAALELAQESLALRETALGADDEATAVSHVHVGRALSGLGRHSEAIDHFERALTGLESTSPHHPLVASIRYFAGQAHEAVGDVVGAREIYTHALEALAAAGQPDRPGVRELRAALDRLDQPRP
jgi:serine/threonine protein kinase/tetratricopeptide (TPR) repeat protein